MAPRLAQVQRAFQWDMQLQRYWRDGAISGLIVAAKEAQMIRLQLAFLAGVCAVHPGMAQTVDCKKAQTQLELTACAQRDWQIADRDLSEAYRAAQMAMKAIDANGVGGKRGASESLRAAERAWITYRDAVCLSESFAWQGGSGDLMVIYACRTRITKARTADLWSMTQPR